MFINQHAVCVFHLREKIKLSKRSCPNLNENRVLEILKHLKSNHFINY